MADVLRQYLRLSTERDLCRALDGLSQEQEAEIASALDAFWWSLNLEEQEGIERLFAQVPAAPESLGLVDRAVTIGAHEPPRG